MSKDLNQLLEIVPENMRKHILEAYVLGSREKTPIFSLCGYCEGENAYIEGYDCPACVDGFSGV